MTSRIPAFIIAVIFLMTACISVVYADDANKLDLNKATAEELAKVPGMNKDLADKIVQKRQENGEFVDMEELLDVDGVDNNLLRALKQYVFIKDVAGCNC